MVSNISHTANGLNLKNYAYDFGPSNGEKIFWRYLRKFTTRELVSVLDYEMKSGHAAVEKEKRGVFIAFRLRSMFQHIPEIKPAEFMNEYQPKLRQKDTYKSSGELWPEVKEPSKIKTVWEAVCGGLI